MQRGAIILSGGRSSRMGVDKSLLPFGEGTMLERIVETVGSVVEPRHIVIVAAAEQELPFKRITIVRDLAEYQGPLGAISSGVETVKHHVDAVFVTGCDTPLLQAAVVNYLFARLADFECVVPRDADRLFPLCAVYRCSILSRLQAFTGRSLHAFLSNLKACMISCDELREVDPELNSLRNVNTRADYEAALAAAGLSTP